MDCGGVVDSQPFLIDSVVNTTTSADAFVDSGCLCYCAVRADFAQFHLLQRKQITPRELRMAADDSKSPLLITEIAQFELDLEGWVQHVWAYVIPDLAYPIILGKPWLENNDIVYFAQQRQLQVRATGQVFRQKGWEQAIEYAHQRAARPAIAQLMHAVVKRARKSPEPQAQKTVIFTTSIHDINKALEPKVRTTLEEIRTALPAELQEFAYIFEDTEGTQLPPHRPHLDHEINLEEGKAAPWGPLYGMSREELLVLRKTLTGHMEKGWIRASSSSASAPVLFVRKANGDLRFCCDYRAINALTKQDRYPLPLIRETLRDVGQADWMTKIDIRAAFHRLRVKAGDEWKTAFRTRFGLFEWLVTPFGLAGAPASFQRFINHILRDRLGIDVTAYMDDILIYTKGSKSEHLKAVKDVLRRLAKEDLRLDPKKSVFGVKQVTYLGFIVTAGKGISMDPAKVEAVTKWEAPTNVRDVRAFLGFANFYRPFIRDFSQISTPLSNLTKKDTPFIWRDEQSKAFEILKAAFTTAPILAHFDPDLNTVVEPDGSGWSLGSCLSQWHGDVLRPVAYLSTKLSPAEVNYDIHDKEMLGIIRSLEDWRPELTSVAKPFEILTDHKNLVYFMTSKRLSERQVRWAEFLSRFNFTMIHRPGKLNARADALSRQGSDLPSDTDERVLGRTQTMIKPEWVHRDWRDKADVTVEAEPISIAPIATSTPQAMAVAPLGTTLFEDTTLSDLWDEGVRHDAALAMAYDELAHGMRSFSPAIKEKVSLNECRIDQRGALLFRDRIWVPNWEPLKTALIHQVHDAPGISEHPGREATREMLCRQFFWPHMANEVRQFLHNCDRCGRTKIWREAKRGLLKPLPIPQRFWTDISIDFMTDLPAAKKGDNRYLMVITDRLQKGCVLEAMPSMDARLCAERFAKCWWRYHGFPKSITSDRGSNWTSQFWAELCKIVGIERKLTTAYNPRSDGHVERWNQEIQTILRGVVSYAQEDWPLFLDGTMFALNNRVNTTYGMSPFYVTHGFHPDTVELKEEEYNTTRSANANDAASFVDRMLEAQEIAQAAMGWAQERMEAEANKTRRPAEQFRVGDKVWLDLRHIKSPRTSKKLAWTHAKFTVTAVPFPHTVELNVPGGIHPRFHVELLRHAHDNPLPSQQRDDEQIGPAILADDNEDEEWEIEKVLRVESSTWYGTRLKWALVKWSGYIEPSWEPLDEIQHSDAFGRFVAEFGQPGDTAVGEANQQSLGTRNRSVSAQYAKRIRNAAKAVIAKSQLGDDPS